MTDISEKLEQELEQTEQAIKTAHSRLETAQAKHHTGDEAYKDKRWQAAIAALEEARGSYAEAAKTLHPYTQASGDAPMAALRVLHREAKELYNQAEQGRQEIEQQAYISDAHLQTKCALEKMDQARQALDASLYDNASTLAREAASIDPTLTDKVNGFLRDVQDNREMGGDKQGALGIILALVVLVIVVAVAWFLWTRFGTLFQ